MQSYLNFLQSIDEWFASILSRHADQMQCRRGCALCCHGLFDISLPDALLVTEGMMALPDRARVEVGARAEPLG